MSRLKCKNCQATIPAKSIKCEYCDAEVSIIDAAKNISIGDIAQTGKSLSKKGKPIINLVHTVIGNFARFFWGVISVGIIVILIFILLFQIENKNIIASIFLIFCILAIFKIAQLGKRKIKEKYNL